MNQKKIAVNYQPIAWMGDRVRILDQTRLPAEETYIETSDYLEVAAAIKELKVRGAPLIGVAGLMEWRWELYKFMQKGVPTY